MKHKRLKLSALFLLGLGLINLQAQESVNSSGGEALGNGGSVSYTVGQVAYGTNTGTNGELTEGVQQAYEIFVTTGIEEMDVILNISAYPNPTTDFLQLKIESEKMKNLSFQLYNINGKLLQNKKITGTESQINMTGLVSAIYFVIVLSENQIVKSFKIIKK